MERIYYVIEKDIPKIENNQLKKIIICDNDYKRWAIKDNYNNFTPFFTNDLDIIVKHKNYCVFVGENDEGKYLYFSAPANSRQSTIYGKIDNINDINKIENLENDENNILIFNNKDEVCLFDITTFEQKTDFFSELSYINSKMLFTKEIVINDKTRKYYGLVDNNGKISNYIYDITNNNYKRVPLLDKKEKFDIIDEDVLKKEAINEYKKELIVKSKKL